MNDLIRENRLKHGEQVDLPAKEVLCPKSQNFDYSEKPNIETAIKINLCGTNPKADIEAQKDPVYAKSLEIWKVWDQKTTKFAIEDFKKKAENKKKYLKKHYSTGDNRLEELFKKGQFEIKGI